MQISHCRWRLDKTPEASFGSPCWDREGTIPTVFQFLSRRLNSHWALQNLAVANWPSEIGKWVANTRGHSLSNEEKHINESLGGRSSWWNVFFFLLYFTTPVGNNQSWDISTPPWHFSFFLIFVYRTSVRNSVIKDSKRFFFVICGLATTNMQLFSLCNGGLFNNKIVWNV